MQHAVFQLPRWVMNYFAARESQAHLNQGIITAHHPPSIWLRNATIPSIVVGGHNSQCRRLSTRRHKRARTSLRTSSRAETARRNTSRRPGRTYRSEQQQGQGSASHHRPTSQKELIKGSRWVNTTETPQMQEVTPEEGRTDEAARNGVAGA